MTATYDGKLLIARDAPKVNRRHVEPCCADMSNALFCRVIYLSGKQLRIRTSEKDGIDMHCCPFCGAIPEVEE